MRIKAIEITPEMERALLEARIREDLFFKRHGIEHESDKHKTGMASAAHQAWVRAVEFEYDFNHEPTDSKLHLDTPLARKAFVLGFNKGRDS